MSIWGKLIGGVTGFAVGGPLGAIVGAVAGHAVDKLRDQDANRPPPDSPEDLAATKQAAFAAAVVVLGAKMAKADGQVTKDEIATFKRLFHIPPEEEKQVGALFNQARRSAEGYEPYAAQIARMFQGNPAVLEELLGGLFEIAKADGHLHPAELVFLRRVGEIFGFSGAAFETILARHAPPKEADPYSVLGLTRDADDQTVKKTYRALIRENHPDKLVAEGLPQEFVDVATRKMAAINAAYDQIAKSRGLK